LLRFLHEQWGAKSELLHLDRSGKNGRLSIILSETETYSEFP
jgi:hypothetical protein